MLLNLTVIKIGLGQGKDAHGPELKSYKEALHAQALDISAENSSSALKAAVRTKLEGGVSLQGHETHFY
jgi:hypothetical protein